MINIQRWTAIVTVVVILLSSVGCGNLNKYEVVENTNDPLYVEQSHASEEAARREDEEKAAAERGETLPEPTFGTPEPFQVMSYEFSYDKFASGKLVVTVLDAWVVDHIDEMPTEGQVHPYDWYIYMEEGWTVFYDDMKQFVREDGSFEEGVFLVMVKTTVENRDASVRISEAHKEKYPDPYMFRIQYMVQLTELDINRKWTAGYSSSYGSHPDHPYAIHIEPGETVELTVGFWVGDNWDGSTRDLSNLAAGSQFSTDGWAKIPLGLSNYDLDQKEGEETP